ncbi:hypothetical protein B0H66DRAFT_35248 [Apodospora peruviana]|uniref:Uncharacterized protein n=1 Tax=Apodospora peruviana TaxID=516989 RepID=A0AAE0IR62_9PEZI|nr:hypothetical protein B0H66DRAFT_35248 [Apodospora peruviana]
MGVNGLWTVVQPCARPTNLATLNRKRLAVDASIWIYQFLKAVRDKEGNALRNSHVVGFFRRICKLLWFGILPVFVFDGGAPALKRATLQGRRQKREGRREDAARTAGKLLAVQMHRLAEQGEEKRKRRVEVATAAESETVGAGVDEEEQEQLPDAAHIVYADELGMSQQERQKNRRFQKKDAYHLPDLQGGIEGMGKPDDPRIMSVEELEEYARQFNDGEDINLYDFSKIDFDGEFFKSLPPADRYNILNAARIRSRLRMGLSKEQLDVMFPNRMDFSRFQIERVKERNHLTQRLMYEMGMTGTDLTVGVNARVAGEKNREYILVKNDGAEGGWALGVVSREKDRGEIHKPIDVDALAFQYQAKEDEEDEDEDFEDVPIEGLNRLPKLSQTAQGSYLQTQDLEEDSLFVGDGNNGDPFSDDGGVTVDDEEEDLNRAIALSLQNQHGVGGEEKEDSEGSEDVQVPQWTQKAAEAAPKPIFGTTGRMVAHIVNNRASAAVPRRRDSDSGSSDSDVDIRTALAAARKKKKPAVNKPVVEKAPIKHNVKNPFDGPLPFEKLNWRNLFSATRPFGGAMKKTEEPKPVGTGELEAESDDEAGGFERSGKKTEENREDEGDEFQRPQEDAPRPLPPWLADNTTDIRDSVRKQQELDREMNAQDEEMAREEELLFQRQKEEDIIEINSSDESDDDIEILDAPPLPLARLPFVERKLAKPPGASLPSLDDDIQQSTKLDSGKNTLLGSSNQPPSLEIMDTDIIDDTMHDSPAKEISEADLLPGSPEDEAEDMFEDVDVHKDAPSQPDQPVRQSPTEEEVEDARLEAELFGDSTSSLIQHERTEGLAPVDDDLFGEPDAPGPEEFDEFSDPEEEELLAQMAEEAEEHARFASELNNKSQQENQKAYEEELKALRTQQKKDRRDADEVTQVMVAECQALLRLFGIPYITAPMEAEAQCAELVKLSLVDGIVTDDSDIFLFGGTRVYKNMFNSNKFVECYLASDIDKELSLSREQLISLAQLLGSDYTEGLPGVGPVTAVEILSEFPGRDGLADFKEWWQDVQSHGRSKEADAGSTFRRKFRKSQATKLFLPVGFPSPAVFDAYLHPEVDANPEQFQWGIPDLEGLRQFLMTTIGWGPERTDEVLVPVIKDMNRREMEGTQSNITRYFEGSVGVGAKEKESFAPRKRANKGSKRMADAVSKLRAKAGGMGGGMNMDFPLMALPEEGKKTRKRKRKAKAPVVVADDDDDDDDNNGDEDDDEDEDEAPRRRKKGKGKAVVGKRSKASS